MTAFIHSHAARYNKLKMRALEIFELHGGWLRPPAWALRAGFRPVRAAYTYLLRLHRFGLLERDYQGRRVAYRLSRRGKVRLAWLKRVVQA